MFFPWVEFGACWWYSMRKSRMNIYIWECECFEWVKFEKLRQSERWLLLFLCLFRPLSKALLKVWYTQPTHFCTQIVKAASSSSSTIFQNGLFSLASYACTYMTVRLSACAVWYRQSAFSSSYSMNPTHLKPLRCVCECVYPIHHALLYARTVFPTLTPQHTEFQCVFAINSRNLHVMDTSGWYCFHSDSNRSSAFPYMPP